MQAALVEHLHRGLEADALDPADQLTGRHPAVVEDHVTGMRALLSHLAIRLAQGQPGRTALDDESGDSAGATDRRVGARHHGVDAGLRGVGDEALGTVEHVVLAVTHRRGLQRGGVGTGVRFGEAERTEQFARRQARQAAVGLRDRQAEQAHLAHAGDDRLGDAVGFRHFLLMRHQAFADELADAVQQQVQGFRITNHAHSNRPLGRLP